MLNSLKLTLLTCLFSIASVSFASEGSSGGFDAVGHALHHASDAHDIHLWGKDESSFSIPLPVILYTDNGLVMFMSSAFHHDDHGHHVVEAGGQKFIKVHEKIYQLNGGADEATFDEKGHPTNAVKPLDFSITKNVFTMFLVAGLMFFLFLKTAKFYKKEKQEAPRGVAGWLEPVILFVKNIADESIEKSRSTRYVPFLLTLFFFILFGNLLGLIPFISNPNMTGSISVCLLLASMVFITQMFSTRKYYWGHIFMPPGVPKLLLPIMIPIEVAGILIKPFSLMIRLFANITAGHIMVVSLISIMFIYAEKSSPGVGLAWSGVSVPFTLFISVLEILVAFLQAYIFTMLSALYLGMAVEEPHHH
jgi:F-type H+-transporting ATPase subunit a